MPERPRFEGDNPRFNIPAPGTYMPTIPDHLRPIVDLEPPNPFTFDPNLGQPPPESFGIGNTLMPPDPYASPYFNDPYSYLPNEPEPFAPSYGGYQSPDNRPAGRTGGPNRGGGNNPIYNNPMNNMGNTNIVPTARRVPVAPPPGYRPGIDPEWNYFPNSNPPATTMGQYPYGITPPANLPNFGNALAGVEDFDFSNLDLSNLDLSGLGFSQPSTPSVQQPATPQIAQPTMPEIDYDLLASKFNFPSQPAFEMPDYSDLSERLAGIETGLGGLENRFQNFQVPEFKAPEINYDLLANKINMPDYTKQFENLQTGLGGLGSQIGNIPSYEMPNFDYDQLAGNIAGQIQMPSFEMPDYTQQFQNLQTGLGGLGTQLGNMPSFQMPDYSQQFENLQGSLGGLGEQIGGLQTPSFEMPDYSQQFADIQSGLGGLGTQLGNMPSYEMPNYNQQFENLQQQIGGMGYGGPSLEDIQGMMPSYQGYGGPSLEDIQGIMPSYQTPDYSSQFENLQQQIGGLGYGGPSLEDIQGIIPSYQSPDLSNYMTKDLLESSIQNDPRLRGAQGLTGMQGLQGLQGLEGMQGLQGQQGLAGAIGQQGLQGLQGLEGLQGLQGMQGLEGAIGQQGLAGAAGAQGLQGMQGMQGMQGAMGLTGAAGESIDPSELEALIAASQQSYNPYNPTLGPSDRPLGFAKGGSIRYQEGAGIAGLEEGAEMTEGNEQLIEATIMAIQGMAPDQATADAIINQFIGLYGQEAFMTLREQVLNPDGGAQTQGMIEGFGGGMDDFVQGVAGNQDRIAASPGEYIVPADVVSQLGDGNSTEGSRKLDGMLERTRMAKTGTIKQAPPIDSRRVLPA